MDKITPDYENLGFADKMGPELKSEVENQLIKDLEFYKISEDNLKFDWSESCIEGHLASVLDGTVENFSGISVFDNLDNLVADGWMDFIFENELFIVYWEFVRTWDGNKKLKEKKEVGLPNHIWKKLPDELKLKYNKVRIKK